jgi:hypothetical protein
MTMSENKPTARRCNACNINAIHSGKNGPEKCDWCGSGLEPENKPEDKLREDQKRIASALNLEPEMGEGWCSVESILKRIGEWDGDRERAWKENKLLAERALSEATLAVDLRATQDEIIERCAKAVAEWPEASARLRSHCGRPQDENFAVSGEDFGQLRRENAEMKTVADQLAKRVEELEETISTAIDRTNDLVELRKDLDDAIQRGQNYQEEWHEAEMACREANRQIVTLTEGGTAARRDAERMRACLEELARRCPDCGGTGQIHGHTMNGQPNTAACYRCEGFRAALSAPDSQPTPTKPNEKYFPREDIADLRELVTVLDEAQNTEELNAAVVAIREILEHPAVEPPTSPRTRCSCSFAHPPHDFCDGNPGAKFVAALSPAANPATRFHSFAQWPDTVNTGRSDHVSTDDHDTREAALAVCRELVRSGFGGDGKVFPLRAWIEPIPAANPASEKEPDNDNNMLDPNPIPSDKAVQAMKRIAAENKTPQAWIDGTDDPTKPDPMQAVVDAAWKARSYIEAQDDSERLEWESELIVALDSLAALSPAANPASETDKTNPTGGQ